MDTLVTKYSKPAYERNAALEDDAAMELTDPWASLSLKFAMPPITHVRPTTIPLPSSTLSLLT